MLRSPQLVDECLHRMGVDPAHVEPMTYEDARAAAFDEEWKRRDRFERDKGAHDDFEDDLVIAAAHRMNADLIVTEDLAFVRHSPLPTMSAEDALRWITS